MATMTITLHMDNAAFGDDLNAARPELCRILRRITHGMETEGIANPEQYNVMDSNGNTCGTVQFTR
jgi:hypothetical protein